MERIYLALAALGGGILVALAGKWDAHEPFDWRKFGASAIRSLFAGLLFAYGYKLSGLLGVPDIFWGILSGAGFDVGVNRVAGALGNGSFPLPVDKIEKKVESKL